MAPSLLDVVYRRLILTKFFTKGWGTPENLRRIFEFKKVVANRNACYNLIPRDYPITITKDEEWSDCHIIEGCFETPFERHLPNIMPEQTKTSYFQLILPRRWTSHKAQPVCLHLAGTGDHYFWRRRNLIAKPLLKETGIGSLLMENPFYGVRKPPDQIRSNLHNVSDIFIMGGCLIMESIVMLNWCEKQGFGPLGLTGLSMGGHMASLAATSWPKPIPLVPCLSWSTASPVFTQGVMSESIDWSLLQSQYFSDTMYHNDLSKMVNIDDQDDGFLTESHFAQHFPVGISRIHDLKNRNETFMENKEIYQNNFDITEQLAAEEEAARMFPLNLLASQFKSDKLKRMKELYELIKCKVPSALRRLCTNSLRVLRGASYVTGKTEIGLQCKKMKEVRILPSTNVEQRDLERRQQEALKFMRGIMDSCTHLKNFEIPVDTNLVIAICAKDDAYVPRDNCTSLEKIWPGVEIRYIDAGHVSAYLLHQKLYSGKRPAHKPPSHTETDDRYNNNNRGGGTNGQRRWTPHNNNNKGFDRKSSNTIRCARCNGYNHHAKDCYSKNIYKHANYAEEEEEEDEYGENIELAASAQTNEEIALMNYVNNANKSNDKNLWCLDSGSTSHITANNKLFKQIEKANLKLSLANNDSTQISGVGEIKININDGNKQKTVKFDRVLYVNDLRTNLLSVLKMTDKNYKILFEKEKATISDINDNVLITAKRIGNLYYIQESQNAANLAEFNSKNDFEKWHQRLGHVNEKDIKLMCKQGILNIPKSTQEIKNCEVCAQEKVVNQPFPKSNDGRTTD
ncbi:protein ABHD18 isoform X2 [Aphidius gifuensis]|uniref:protein ABHD18 isoform X2 n=1 Tax=Aphidius gifuensis TaxID=684658 RepID=UPI001CDD1E1B|nr:protein ABHD18 isoform X2 [Aphidius gifuensis]